MAAEMISTIVLFGFDISSGKRLLSLSLLPPPAWALLCPSFIRVAVISHHLWHEVQVPPTHLSNTTLLPHFLFHQSLILSPSGTSPMLSGPQRECFLQYYLALPYASQQPKEPPSSK